MKVTGESRIMGQVHAPNTLALIRRNTQQRLALKAEMARLICDARDEGWSLREIAKETEVSFHTVSNIAKRTVIR